MKENILIARAVRNWTDGIAEVTLVWNTHYSKLRVEYRQVGGGVPDNSTTISDHCVKHWLNRFVRDQTILEPDSYYITVAPGDLWRDIISGILIKSLQSGPKGPKGPKGPSALDDVMESAGLEASNSERTCMILFPNVRWVSEFKRQFEGLKEYRNVHLRASTVESSLKSLALDTLILVGENHSDWNERGEMFARGQLVDSRDSFVINMAQNLGATYDYHLLQNLDVFQPWR